MQRFITIEEKFKHFYEWEVERYIRRGYELQKCGKDNGVWYAILLRR